MSSVNVNEIVESAISDDVDNDCYDDAYRRLSAVLLRTLCKAKTNVLCVDGTSCCKKTSILNAIGILPVLKVQKYRNFVNSTTYAPSAMGYVCAGMSDVLQATEFRVMDRSPLNVLEWHVLWKYIDKYVKLFGNVAPDLKIEEHFTFFNEFDIIFKSLKDSYFYDFFRQRLDTLAIIDSNIERCDNVLLRRSTGSDAERAGWKFYTFMQNRMYCILYEYIDISWFDGVTENQKDVVAILASELKQLLFKFTKNTEINDWKKFKLPISMVGVDLTLRNFHTFAYRSMIRNRANMIVAPQCFSVKPRPLELPSFANISESKTGVDIECTPFQIRHALDGTVGDDGNTHGEFVENIEENSNNTDTDDEDYRAVKS